MCPKWGRKRRATPSTPPIAPCPHGALTAKERANILRRWFNLMMEHQDDLARLMTLEQGKPLAEAKAKLATPPRLLNGSPKREAYLWRHDSGHQADKRLLVIKQPIGVTAAITPWNFPRQ